MKHVRKGCLARPREDIPSDGSRIEGSHKGWNSIQRAFASGLVMFRALSHDFVLRRNIRVGLNGRYRKPSPFLSSTHGCHHIRLVSHTAHIWNVLISKAQRSNSHADHLELLPELRIVNSNEIFGVVDSQNAMSFGGLFQIKQEDEKEYDLLDAIESDETPPGVLSDLEIDPAQLSAPQLANTTPKLEATSWVGLAPASEPVVDSIVSTLPMRVHVP
jgi:hypothetical protein